ncbi:MAG TPA: sulfotransferase [Candidatus Acidoferrales bacterium]|nr:sulfotransferase [Candidatus Acidoferrales bacterium]
MNRRQQHRALSQTHHKPVIHWRGRSCSLGEACLLALQEQQLGNFQAAADIYGLVLALDPDCAEVHNNRGAVLQQMRRYEESLAGYARAITLKPDYANAHYNRGTVLKQMHRYSEALASFEKTLALRPDHAEACNNCGLVLATLGKIPEAEKMFRQAHALKPDFPDPLFNLVNIRKYQDMENPEAGDIHQLLEKPGTPTNAKEILLFALGKIYDDCGCFDEAFECFKLANRIRNAAVAYHPDEIVRRTDDIIDVFNRDFLAQPFASASASRSPLFLVGMPRSGTTLLANMLSHHRAIGTAGELPAIIEFASELAELAKNGFPYPQAAKHLTSTTVLHLVNDYERRLKRDFGADAPVYVIDKNPLNFQHLGFIAKLFPEARIIHCTRDPLDTGLSNYFVRFPLNLDYSFDLRNIGHFYRQYVRLMQHWRLVLPRKIIEISYEDMVLNTEQTARRALEFLGLEWDDHCLTPHTNPCPVETASQWQVRQPIYRHALERWRRYEKHLTPLKEALSLNEPISVG